MPEGISVGSVSRRGLIGGAMMLPVAATLPPEEDQLERAIAAMGGRELLSRIKSVAWSGRLYTYFPDNPFDQMIMTSFEPFGSWWSLKRFGIAPEGELSTNRIGPDGAWTKLDDGAWQKMDADETASARALFGLCSYMLLVHTPTTIDKMSGAILASRDGFPSIELQMGRDGLRSARYASMNTLIEFEGIISEQGLRWPRVINFFYWVVGSKPILSFRLTIGNLFVDLA